MNFTTNFQKRKASLWKSQSSDNKSLLMKLMKFFSKIQYICLTDSINSMKTALLMSQIVNLKLISITLVMINSFLKKQFKKQ